MNGTNICRHISFILALNVGVVTNSVMAANEETDRGNLTRISADHYVVSTGIGGNVGINVGGDGVILIDDEYAEFSQKLGTLIQDITPREVDIIINTHWHPDHVGGNATLGAAQTTIIAHSNVRNRVSTVQRVSGYPPVAALPESARPNLTFSHSVRLYLNNDEIELIHLKDAHTDGDIAVMFKNANILYTGDIFTANQYPYIDADTGGSACGMIEATEHLYDMIDEQTVVVPGHGAIVGRAKLASYRDMLLNIASAVERHLRAGESYAELAARNLTAVLDGSWNGQFVEGKDFVLALAQDYEKNDGFSCL